MRGAAVLIGLPLVLYAQSQSPAPSPEASLQTFSTLAGQVFNAATGEPVSKAALTLQRANAAASQAAPPRYTTTTDGSGRFAMKDIEAGSYRLSAARSGFIDSAYGEKAPGRPGTTIALDQTHSLNDLVLRMTPQGVVTGRVLDSDGDPVTGIRMELARFRYIDGQKRLSSTDFAFTNDLGEYRIFGVSPGKYYLTAVVTPNPATTGVDRSAVPPAHEDYVPEFFPGTPDLRSAALLEVTPGADLRNPEMVLRKERIAKLSGSVINEAGQGLSPINVELLMRGAGAALISRRATQADAAGKFEFRSVPPGSYYLRATVFQAGQPGTGREAIEVAGEDVDNLAIAMRPYLQVTGRVHAENDAAVDLHNVRVTLQAREALGLGGAPPRVGVKDDGSFALATVTPDDYNVFLFGLPDGFYMKSVHAGQLDVLVAGLDLSGGPPGELDVLLSPNAAQLNGMVQSPKTQQLAPGATVVLVPDAPERLGQSVFYRMAAADQTGHFTMKNVVPGKYTAYAWEDVETGAYYDPDFVKSHESWGAPIEVTEGAQLNLQLTQIPAE